MDMNKKQDWHFPPDFESIQKDNIKKALESTESDPEIREYIMDKINTHKVVIFSRTYCSQSKLAKYLFHELDHIYHAVELDKLNCGYAMLLELVRLTENDHLPHVYVKGEYIGGGVDLEPLNDLDKLRERLDLPPPPMFVESKVPWLAEYENPEGMGENQVPFGQDPGFIHNQ